MSNVVDLPVITTLDLDADRVLVSAQGRLSEVVVIGYTHDGEEYFAFSKSDGGAVLWHLERAKLRLLRQSD